MNKFFLYIIFFLVFISVKGQYLINSTQSSPLLQDIRTDTTFFPRYRIVNVGLGSQTLRDPLLSTLRYKGKLINCSINTIKFRTKFLTISSLSMHINMLGNKSTGAKIYEIGGSYSFTMLKNIKNISNEKWQFYVGASTEAMFNFRLALSNVNNMFAYDASISVGASGLIQRNFKLFHRNFSISNQINVPFYNIISRPQYSWSYPLYAEEGGKIKDDIQTGSFGKFFKIQNKLTLDFQLGMRHHHKSIGKSAWRFTYQYEYYNISQLNRVQSGTVLFMIGRIHRF